MFDTPANSLSVVSIEEELKNSFIDYAMSVIVSRALPDARDGLKPVHRRILYTMYRLANRWDKPYVKSARVVGDTMGKLHPHGDAAIYDALVRMAQDFSLRYPLVDGQGNFGSIDGDPPAAMRYTEVRMARLAGELLADIDKETVDFVPNYDGKDSEPTVLPTRFPNLLVNGASGIAVGMATNVPPHNLGEVLRACKALLTNPELQTRDLLHYIPGPDFPTGGIIYGRHGLREAYESGRGSVTIRARTHFEESNGRTQIVVTELPYQVNKAALLERIAELVKAKELTGISDIRDESDREGMRVVLQVKRDAQPEVVLNHLFKHTALQKNFGVNLIAIVDRRPKLLSLKGALQVFLRHRRDVVTRRSRHELQEASARREVVEGLGLASVEIDRVIQIIRSSRDPEEAKMRLMAHEFTGLAEFLRRAGRPESEIQKAEIRGVYRLSERQAQAILDMRLHRLTGLQQEKLAGEYADLCSKIEELTRILTDEERLKEVLIEELDELEREFGDERRTEIVAQAGDIDIESLVADEDMMVTTTVSGYVKRTALAEFRAQQRGGKGRRAAAVKAEDEIADMFVASALAHVLMFTNTGRVFSKRVYEFPELPAASRGKSLANLLELQSGERVVETLPVSEFSEGQFVFLATAKGYVKKTLLDAFSNIRSTGIIAVVLDEGDSLIEAALTDGSREIVLATAQGQAIRFPEAQVRPMGRVSRGVRGIGLRPDDEVVGMTALEPGRDVYLLTVTEFGYGKLTQVAEYPIRNRAGIGVLTARLTEKTGRVVGLKQVGLDDHVMLITSRGRVIRIRVRDIKVLGRVTSGVILVRTTPEERVTLVARIPEPGEEDTDRIPGETGDLDGGTRSSAGLEGAESEPGDSEESGSLQPEGDGDKEAT